MIVNMLFTFTFVFILYGMVKYVWSRLEFLLIVFRSMGIFRLSKVAPVFRLFQFFSKLKPRVHISDTTILQCILQCIPYIRLTPLTLLKSRFEIFIQVRYLQWHCQAH